MIKKMRNFRIWLFANPYRAAVAGFTWFVPGFWFYSLLLRPEKFLQNLNSEILLSIVLGIGSAFTLYIIAKTQKT